uniref:COesterase domain-containing protein n=1 Tax=Heterorhabditis bacteriophora TaxID=37862 RepID=A0A1I7XBB0_HETBA
MPWKGIWNATTYGPACMSNSSTSTSIQKWVDEDCLHINLFAGADCLVSYYLFLLFFSISQLLFST